MKFVIITLFPDLIQQILQMGVIGQAIASGSLQVRIISPREFTQDTHKTVDDRPFGGGDGMLMLADPLAQLMQSLGERQNYHSIFLSPQGKVLDHQKTLELSKESREIVLICGRYAGIDQRFINQFVDEEISLGDFVLSGGEIAALALVDAVGRQIDGVLGHKDSALCDSFAGEGFLEAPAFTRPRLWGEYSVPEFLLSGDHKKIAEHRKYLSWLITFKKRPDLFNRLMLSKSFQKKELQRLMKTLANLSESDMKSLALSKDIVEQFIFKMQSLISGR